MKSKCLFFVFLLLWTAFSGTAADAETRLTILHTNDLHSQFLGLAPNSDYTPMKTGDDKTVGGWARIATVIKEERNSRENPVLVLDAGDFLMGSLFHMVSREEAYELVLMKEMGFDITTLGNHEFDLKPEGLARILASAARKGKLPDIVASNVLFSETDKRDDGLETLFRKGPVKPYIVLQKADLKIGIFGLVGTDAAGVAPFASPVKFEDPVEAARKMVNTLRNEEKVDLVICLSHSGLREIETKSEDEILSEAVAGIDIIVSGHTHTRLHNPIVKNDTIIVQAWEYGKEMGLLEIGVDQGKVSLVDYRTIVIDDSIQGDPEIHAAVNTAIDTVNKKVLQPYGLEFDKVLVETAFDLPIEQKETSLGNLITDATRWAVDKAEYDPSDPISRVNISIQSNGVIRDNILVGNTGQVTVADLFRIVPLGIGWDGSMSYPLVSFYITAAEIKKACEILTTVYPLKGSDYFLQFSGARVIYNPNRMLFDRVTGIYLEDEKGVLQPLDYSGADKRLYKTVSNIYNATFIKVIGDFTYGILTIVPKDREGNPISDLADFRVDGDHEQPGVQEIKDWTALMSYVGSFADKDGNGIPDIPDRYRDIERRLVVEASLNPVRLLSGGSYVTWIAFAVLIVVLVILVFAGYLPIRIIRKRKRNRIHSLQRK